MNFTRVYWSKTYLKQSNRSYILLLFVWLLISFSSCKKVDDFYLEGNTPGQPFNLFVSDSTPVVLQTRLQGRIRTNNLRNDLLGAYIDPVFGRTTASVYTQLSLDQFNPDFIDISKVDSFILYIRVRKNAFSGNPDDAQHWKVYELQNALSNDDIYSDSKPAIENTIIGSYSGPVNEDIIRVPLTESFAKKFFAANKSSFQDNTSFSNFLKGIAILPDSVNMVKGRGSIISVDLASSESKMVLYYSNDNIAKSFAMKVGSNSRLNTYTHNYTGTEAGKALSSNSGKAYLQPMAGLSTVITLPELKNQAGGDLVLHRAEMVFPQADSSADPQNTNHPDLIFLAPRNKEGENIISNYTGQWSESDRSYHVEITEYIEAVLNAYRTNAEFTDYGFNLFIPADNPVTPKRVVLSANQNAANRPKLVLTFTKLDQ